MLQIDLRFLYMKTSGSRIKALSSLRNRNFSLLWFGMFASVNGMQMLIVARGWLVYTMTESPVALGLVSAGMGLPIGLEVVVEAQRLGDAFGDIPALEDLLAQFDVIESRRLALLGQVERLLRRLGANDAVAEPPHSLCQAREWSGVITENENQSQRVRVRASHGFRDRLFGGGA